MDGQPNNQLALKRHEGVEELLVIRGISEPEYFHGLQQLFLVLYSLACLSLSSDSGERLCKRTDRRNIL